MGLETGICAMLLTDRRCRSTHIVTKIRQRDYRGNSKHLDPQFEDRLTMCIDVPRSEARSQVDSSTRRV